MSGFAGFAYYIFMIWNNIIDYVFSILMWDIQEEKFKGVMLVSDNIVSLLTAVGSSLCLIFWAIGLAKALQAAHEINTTFVFKRFFRLIVANAMVILSSKLMIQIWKIGLGLVKLVSDGATGDALHITPTDEILEMLESYNFDLGTFDIINTLKTMLSILPAFTFAILCCLCLILFSLAIYIVLLGRFIKIYLSIALSPVGISFLASEETSQHGIVFLKSYIGECFRGLVMVVILMVYSAFLNTDTFDTFRSALDVTGASTGDVVNVISVGSNDLMMFFLEILVKIGFLGIMLFSSDRFIKEKFNL